MLVVEHSHGEPPAGHRFTTDVRPERPVVIGRGESADVRLVDPAVSRRALLLQWADGEVGLTDLSESGARVNGGPRWPRMQPLHSEDLIEIGAFVLRVELEPVAD